jgi:hypothetical protein
MSDKIKLLKNYNILEIFQQPKKELHLLNFVQEKKLLKNKLVIKSAQII